MSAFIWVIFALLAVVFVFIVVSSSQRGGGRKYYMTGSSELVQASRHSELQT